MPSTAQPLTVPVKFTNFNVVPIPPSPSVSPVIVIIFLALPSDSCTLPTLVPSASSAPGGAINTDPAAKDVSSDVDV